MNTSSRLWLPGLTFGSAVQPTAVDLRGVMRSLHEMRLLRDDVDDFDAFWAMFAKQNSVLDRVAPLPEWYRVQILEDGLQSAPQASLAAQEYKKRGDSNTPATQTAIEMAEAVRVQLGNATSTTGGAGFAGAALSSKPEAGEIAALHKEIQDLRRLIGGAPKAMFKCSRCGDNNTHESKDCFALKRQALKAAKRSS